MSAPLPIVDASRVEEPREASEYAAVLSQVASNHKPVIVSRGGRTWPPLCPWSTWNSCAKWLPGKRFKSWPE